jgi:hypothetical protein
LTAAVVGVDEYWSTQPLTRVDIWMGKSWWRWASIVSVDVPIAIGAEIEMVLEGAPEAVVD